MTARKRTSTEPQRTPRARDVVQLRQQLRDVARWTAVSSLGLMSACAAAHDDAMLPGDERPTGSTAVSHMISGWVPIGCKEYAPNPLANVKLTSALDYVAIYNSYR